MMSLQIPGGERGPTRPYRILHVLDHSFPVLSGYSVRSRSLLKGQQQLGLDPKALTGPLHQVDDVLASDNVVEGVPHLRTPFRNRFEQWVVARRVPGLREAAVVRGLHRRILEVLDAEPFHLVHAHSPALCGLAAWQAARSRGLPFVYEIRAFWEDAAVDQRKIRHASVRYRLNRHLEDYVAHRAHAVVGIAGSILADLRSRGLASEKLFHVPNGVDSEQFTALPRNRELAAQLGLDNLPVLGFIGSLYRYEGVSWLVRAAAELQRRGVQFHLLIVGGGEDLPETQRAVREHAAEAYVHVIGPVPHDQVRSYYSLMDVLVYPRRSVRLTELTTPLKPLEAMAQAKAVLASDVGGIRELVGREGPCLLFPPDDLEDFCRKAGQLVRDEAMRRCLGERARQMILQEKDWKVLARRYLAVYDFARKRQQGRS